MAFKYSTGFKNGVLTTGSVKSLIDAKFLKVYSAPTGAPADADAALPADAVLLNTYSLNGAGVSGLTMAAAAAAGALSKNASEVWRGTAVASGNAAFFRFVTAADTGTSSTTEVRIQGTVGVAGADLNVANVAFTSGNTYDVDFFAIAMTG